MRLLEDKLTALHIRIRSNLLANTDYFIIGLRNVACQVVAPGKTFV